MCNSDRYILPISDKWKHTDTHTLKKILLYFEREKQNKTKTWVSRRLHDFLIFRHLSKSKNKTQTRGLSTVGAGSAVHCYSNRNAVVFSPNIFSITLLFWSFPHIWKRHALTHPIGMRKRNLGSLSSYWKSNQIRPSSTKMATWLVSGSFLIHSRLDLVIKQLFI